MAKMAKTEREQVDAGALQVKSAIAFATKESEAMSAAVVTLMEAKEVTEQGAIAIFLALQSTYGDELGEFPRPGSTLETSNNPDVIKINKTNPQTGNKSVVKSSWYVTFSDNTTEGITLLQELGWLKLLGNPEAAHNLVPKEFKAKHPNPEARKVHEEYLKGRRNTVRKAYKDAMELAYAMQDINSLAMVQADFVWVDPDKRDKVKNTKTPIRVSSTKNADEWQYITQSTAKRFNFDVAKENGGSFTALFDTLKRESGNNSEGNQAKPQLIRTADTFDARITDLHEAIAHTWEPDGKKLKSDITARLLKDGGDDLLLSLDDIHQAIGQWLANDKVAVKLEGARQRQDSKAA